MPKYFRAVYNCAGKADLSKGYSNPKRKLGVATHFSEINKGNYYFKKAVKHKAVCHWHFFFQIEAFIIISEKCIATPNFLFGYQKNYLSSAFSTKF